MTFDAWCARQERDVVLRLRQGYQPVTPGRRNPRAEAGRACSMRILLRLGKDEPDAATVEEVD